MPGTLYGIPSPTRPLPGPAYNDSTLDQIRDLAQMRARIIEEAFEMTHKNAALSDSIRRDALNDEYRILSQILHLVNR